MKNNQLPHKRSSKLIGKDGCIYMYEVSIEKSRDIVKYPEGVKMRMTLLRVIPPNKGFELVELIDNHYPYGVHRHNKLPKDHNSRVRLDGDWKSILKLFNSLVRRYK